MTVGQNMDLIGLKEHLKNRFGLGNPSLVGNLQIHREFIDGWIRFHERIIEVEHDDVGGEDLV